MIETFLITRFNLGWVQGLCKDDYEVWMEDRVTLFKTLTVPSVCKQTCQDFRWLVLIDPYTPKKWIERLQDDAYELIPFSGAPFGEGMKYETARLVEQLRDPNAEKIITCRCDNDDTLHLQYIEYVQNLLMKKPHCSGVYFINGLQRWIDDKGQSTFYDCRYVRNMFPAVIEEAGIAKTVFCEQHTDLPKRFKMKYSKVCRMWIWNYHGHNYSDTQRVVKPKGIKTQFHNEYIKERFGIEI